MPLTLTVTSYLGAAPSTPASISIERERISIGRKKGNSLVLTDPENVVSSKHAEIEYRNDGYYITDTSTNGTSINQTEKMLANGQTAKLNDNDLLTFGDYEVKVSITSQSISDTPHDLSYAGAHEDSSPLLKGDNKFDSAFEDPFADIMATTEDKEDLLDQKAQNYPASDDFSFLKSLDDSDQMSAQNDQPVPDTTDLFADIESFKEDNEKISKTNSQPHAADDDFSFLKTIPNSNTEDPFAEIEPTFEDKNHSLNHHKTASTQPQKPAQQSPSIANTEVELEHIQNFLKGAGITNSSIASTFNSNTFYLIGEMLSCSLQGAIQVLWARSKIKSELGLEVTVVHGHKNNPLKFSPSAQESLIKMLAPQGDAYMPANEAIDEAFRDIGAHEMAVMAGMRSALHDVLKRFNPEYLEQRLQKKSPISVNIPIHKQAKLWGLFQDLYDEIEKEAHDDFNHIFGRAFARAYDDQLRKTKNNR